MEVRLNKKPKNVTLIEGFPGIGLIGTISTEFLMEHMKFEQIGKIIFDDAPAIVAIHKGKIIEPLGIYYNKEKNMVIVHGLNMMYGNEWELSIAILELYTKLNAREVISIEGVGAQEQEIDESVKDGSVFYYTNTHAIELKMKHLALNKLQDGIIMGLTSALILKSGKIPLTCFFAKTHTKLPDSKAAAGIIMALDKYLGLAVDYEPLLKQAQEFEDKLKNILMKGKMASEIHEKKKLDYLG